MSVAALALLRVSVAVRPLCVPLALSLSPVSESVAASPFCVRLLLLVRASVAARPL